MLSEHLDTTYTIVWTLAVANVVGAVACLVPSTLIARLSLIRATRLAPFLLVVLLLGAYQSTASWGDIFAFLAIGCLGWLMRTLGVPRPPFLIGFVLAANTERYLWISASRYGWEWLARPGVIAIGLVIVLLTISGIRLRRATRGGTVNGT
jgi:TctA family transporter